MRQLGICGALAVMVFATRARADGFDGASASALVAKHDALRSQVALGQLGGQPSASDMTAMTWDADLAQVAQAYAAGCTFAHNPDRSSSYDALGHADAVGENIFLTSEQTSDVATFEDGVQSWFDENGDYTFSQNFVPAAGHYTQVVWAGSTRVGCGYAICGSITGSSITSGTLFVCDYAPAGNVQGDFPYTAGSACAACPSGFPNCVNGLCSASGGGSSGSSGSSSGSSGTTGATSGTSSGCGTGAELSVLAFVAIACSTRRRWAR